ncbi:hypothetical protein THRCLA_06387 [Thraustotheca clavata]|uniref:THH1/TOM1/TOM3 domain-containing protein n=1 Tax=Thraustotheca clavata TaxID=74557 RepID=A0A1V9ZPD8_9STRA|nr:hypothetical protein THRCLA_06387 [Thraustotheca clavata]
MNATNDNVLSPIQVVGYKIAGGLSLALYSVVVLGITVQLYHHIRHRSDMKRICFHLLLLLGIMTEIPMSLQYLLNPNSPEWMACFLCSLYSQILQCLALAIIALAWARTAVAGHQDGPITFEKVVIAGNVVILLFALFATMFITTMYPNTLNGQAEFMNSSLLVALMLTGCITLLGTGCFLVVQGCRIASRLLRSRAILGEDKVYRSMAKLIVSLWTIFFCILLRVFFTTCVAFVVPFVENMDIVPFTVWATLVPDVFPVLCLLYLQRKTPTDINERKPSRVVSQVPSEPYTLHLTPSPQLVV